MSNSYQNYGNNTTQNALTKSQRRDRKLGVIAAPDRQHKNTNSYRPYNQYSAPGTHSPTEPHPFTKDPKYVSGIGITAIVNP